MYIDNNGNFLILFSHNKFKWQEQYPELNVPPSRKLYAWIGKVKLSQCGQWMMGTVRALPAYNKPYKYLVVSGAYGADGLPCDYEDLTIKSRFKLIPVPQSIADVYWKGNGWNSSGSEGPTMRQWALEQLEGIH